MKNIPENNRTLPGIPANFDGSSKAVWISRATLAFKIFLVLSALVTVILKTNFAQALDRSQLLGTESRPLVSRCAKVAPDAEYFVPEKIVQHTVPSGSGAYGYRTGCPLWVVDFSLNSKSNTELLPNGDRFHEKAAFFAVAHDLPSSSSAGGEIPIVKEDCERLRVEHFIYKKFKHEPTFLFQKYLLRKGEWIASPKTCRLTKDPYTPPDSFTAEAPNANVLVIRVAVRVKLRTSWQEAAARISDIAAH